jgi:hypothetical protein
MSVTIFPQNMKMIRSYILKHLKNEGGNLEDYKTDQKDWNYAFWQRDPLAIKIISREIAVQKLDYMQYNPLQPHWQLCKDPTEYRFSSAQFYETEEDEFQVLIHFMNKLQLRNVG